MKRLVLLGTLVLILVGLLLLVINDGITIADREVTSIMAGFWPTFLGGVASGIVILILGLFISRRVRRRSEDESVPAFRMRDLRPYLPLLIGLGLLLLGIFGGERVGEASATLVSFGIVLLLVGSIWALGGFD